MELTYDEKNNRIDYFTSQATETKSVVKLLSINSKTNSAIDRIYAVVHYLLMSVALMHDEVINEPESLLKWFRINVADKNLVPFKTYNFAATSLKDRNKVNNEPYADFSIQDVNKKIEELKEFKAAIDAYLTSSPELVTEAIGFIMKSAEILRDSKSGAKEKALAEKFKKFMSARFFLNNKKGKDILEAFMENPNDSKLEGSLETRIEDGIESASHLKKELASIIKEFKKNKISPKRIKMQQAVTEDKEAVIENIDDPADISQEQIKEAERAAAEFSKEAKEKIIKQDKDNLFLVLWDFTERADFALQHAVKFATNCGGEVKLLNIVKKSKEIYDTEQKLEKVAGEAEKKYKIKPTVMARPGDIFTDISKIADELRANIVFMGTHGIRGMQKVTGSWALKVITDTKAPFFVIQEPPKYDTLKEAVFPIDHRRDEKIILKQVKFLSSYFNIKYHILKPARYPNATLKQKAVHNYVFIKSYMKQNNKDFDVTASGEVKDLPDWAIRYAHDKRCDLIISMTTKDITRGDYMFGAAEQKIIANPFRIPVLCVNPIHAKGWFYGAAK